jgi:hypothetical protein
MQSHYAMSFLSWRHRPELQNSVVVWVNSYYGVQLLGTLILLHFRFWVFEKFFLFFLEKDQDLLQYLIFNILTSNKLGLPNGYLNIFCVDICCWMIEWIILDESYWINKHDTYQAPSVRIHFFFIYMSFLTRWKKWCGFCNFHLEFCNFQNNYVVKIRVAKLKIKVTKPKLFHPVEKGNFFVIVI